MLICMGYMLCVNMRGVCAMCYVLTCVEYVLCVNMHEVHTTC